MISVARSYFNPSYTFVNALLCTIKYVSIKIGVNEIHRHRFDFSRFWVSFTPCNSSLVTCTNTRFIEFSGTFSYSNRIDSSSIQMERIIELPKNFNKSDELAISHVNQLIAKVMITGDSRDFDVIVLLFGTFYSKYIKFVVHWTIFINKTSEGMYCVHFFIGTNLFLNSYRNLML